MNKSWLAILILILLWDCNSTDHQHSLAKNVSLKKENKILPSRYNVAFLVMNGTYNAELMAPYDVYQHTQFRENIKQMNVFIVSNTHDLIRTFEGIYIKPDFDFTQDPMPHIDILVIPSAAHPSNDQETDTAIIDWVKKVSSEAMFITSHCDGTSVLAKAELFNGVSCTTFPAEIKSFREHNPSVTVYEDVAFVHDHNIITSAGGSKSFDASLYLIQLLYGKAIADKIAKGLVFEWNLDQVKKVIVHQGSGFSTM